MIWKPRLDAPVCMSLAVAMKTHADVSVACTAYMIWKSRMGILACMSSAVAVEAH